MTSYRYVFVLMSVTVVMSAQNNSDNNITNGDTYDNESVVTPDPIYENSVFTDSTITEEYPQLWPNISEQNISEPNISEPTPSVTNISVVPKVNRSVFSASNQSLFNTSNVNQTIEKLYKKVLKDLKSTEIHTRSKLTVFLAAYLFFPLFEAFWFIRGYMSGDNQMMNKHIARYLCIHMKTFSSFVYVIRIPAIVVYFALLGGHQVLCLNLLSKVPKTLKTQNLGQKESNILNIYYMALKGVGSVVGALGAIQIYLRQRIHALEEFY